MYQRFGPFTIDQRAFELRWKGQPVRISTSLLKLLVLFVEHPGELIPRDQIAACLWDQAEYVDVANGINTAVNRLRTILRDNPAKPVYLETVIGAGYRFKMPVEKITEIAQQKDPAGPAIMKPSHAASPANGMALSDSPSGSAKGSILLTEPQADAKEAGSSPAAIPSPVEPPPSSRRRPIFAGKPGIAALVSLASCVCLGLLFVPHRRHDRVQEKPQPTIPAAFAEVTFNDEANPVITQALSHNGGWLAYADLRGLFARRLDSQVVRSLKLPDTFKAERVTWRPDDSALLVSGLALGANRNKEPQVWRVYLDGQASRLLIHGGSDAVPSSDGSHLAYIGGRGTEIWSSGPAGDSPQRLYQVRPEETLSTLEWSRGGGYLIVEECRNPPVGDPSVDLQGNPLKQCDYKSLDAATGRLLASQPNVRFDSAFLMPDGRLYFSRDLLTEEQSRAGLFLVRTDAMSGRFLESPQLILRLPGDRVSEISASDSGRLMSAVLKRRSSDIYAADISLPGPKLEHVRHLVHVAADNYPHAWSPDGTRVLYESNNTGDYTIYQQGTDASPATELARSQQSAVIPQLSPDHHWIVFEDVSWEPGAVVDGLFRVPFNGGELQQLPLRGRIHDFACPVTRSPQELVSCIVREKAGSNLAFFRFDSVHGEGPQLAIMPGRGSRVGEWGVSSDGNIVALPDHDTAQPQIRLIPISTPGPPARLLPVSLPETGVLLSVAWSPNSDGFYAQVRTGVGYDLVFVALNGRATLLRQTYVPTWGVPSIDGKKLAFVDQTSNTNSWIGAIPRLEAPVDLEQPVRYASLSSLVNGHE